LFNKYYTNNYAKIKNTIFKRIPRGVVADRYDDIEDIVQNVYLYFATSMGTSNRTFESFESFENIFWFSIRRKAITLATYGHYVDETGLHRNVFIANETLYKGDNPEKGHEVMAVLEHKNKQTSGYPSPEEILIKKQNREVLDKGLNFVARRGKTVKGKSKSHEAVLKYGAGEITKNKQPNEYKAAMAGFDILRRHINIDQFDLSVYEDPDWVHYTGENKYCSVPGCTHIHKSKGYCDYHRNKFLYKKKLDKQDKL
jgi:hypothetical protein